MRKISEMLLVTVGSVVDFSNEMPKPRAESTMNVMLMALRHPSTVGAMSKMSSKYTVMCNWKCAVSYTHLTLPTNREV